MYNPWPYQKTMLRPNKKYVCNEISKMKKQMKEFIIGM